MRKTKLTIALDPNVLYAVRICAAGTDRTVSNYINYFLKEHLQDMLNDIEVDDDEDELPFQ